MLWLIWIVLMLLVPCLAGVQVWWEMRGAVGHGSADPSPAPTPPTV